MVITWKWNFLDIIFHKTIHRNCSGGGGGGGEGVIRSNINNTVFLRWDTELFFSSMLGLCCCWAPTTHLFPVFFNGKVSDILKTSWYVACKFFTFSLSSFIWMMTKSISTSLLCSLLLLLLLLSSLLLLSFIILLFSRFICLMLSVWCCQSYCYHLICMLAWSIENQR